MIENPKEPPRCPQCNSQLSFVNGGFKSEEGSTDVFVELKVYCLNPKCKNYAGQKDGDNIVINENSTIAETVRNKVN